MYIHIFRVGKAEKRRVSCNSVAVVHGKGGGAAAIFFVEFEFMICFPAVSFMSFVPKIVRTCVNL